MGRINMMRFLEPLRGLLVGSRGANASATAVDKADEDDRRRAIRRPQRMRSGFLTCPAMPAFPPQPCQIKDLSSTGARVEVLGPLPDLALWATGVRLYFDSENHEILCRMAWHKGRFLGLHFQSGTMPPSRDYRSLVASAR